MDKFMTAFLDEELASKNEDINMGEALALLRITDSCRASMHEPDEMDVYAKFVNEFGAFDNAGGYEMGVTLFDKTDDVAIPVYTFNLASLIALARLGAEAYFNHKR